MQTCTWVPVITLAAFQATGLAATTRDLSIEKSRRITQMIWTREQKPLKLRSPNLRSPAKGEESSRHQERQGGGPRSICFVGPSNLRVGIPVLLRQNTSLLSFFEEDAIIGASTTRRGNAAATRNPELRESCFLLAPIPPHDAPLPSGKPPKCGNTRIQ